MDKENINKIIIEIFNKFSCDINNFVQNMSIQNDKKLYLAVIYNTIKSYAKLKKELLDESFDTSLLDNDDLNFLNLSDDESSESSESGESCESSESELSVAMSIYNFNKVFGDDKDNIMMNIFKSKLDNCRQSKPCLSIVKKFDFISF
jgi:hypothetical protein